MSSPPRRPFRPPVLVTRRRHSVSDGQWWDPGHGVRPRVASSVQPRSSGLPPPVLQFAPQRGAGHGAADPTAALRRTVRSCHGRPWWFGPWSRPTVYKLKLKRRDVSVVEILSPKPTLSLSWRLGVSRGRRSLFDVPTEFSGRRSCPEFPSTWGRSCVPSPPRTLGDLPRSSRDRVGGASTDEGPTKMVV